MGKDWVSSSYRPGDAVGPLRLDSIDFELDVDELYRVPGSGLEWRRLAPARRAATGD